MPDHEVAPAPPTAGALFRFCVECRLCSNLDVQDLTPCRVAKNHLDLGQQMFAHHRVLGG